jgi:RNA 3'-terminal phosphate cyclase-like protein
MVDKMTNGSKIVMNKTGTSIMFVPGIFSGIEHDCSLDRGLGYYLELLLCLDPFCKHPLDVTLRGVTNCTRN